MKDAGNKHRRSQAEGVGIEGYIETKKYTQHRRKKRIVDFGRYPMLILRIT